ncbi:endonuclease/exonuclease/phosphatase family protein [Streptomyces sp. NPDC093228]|uniref:endonuclease/exonuclease/phosphatase family protein n=1 Tax=unclassified Streptomyces TaxID=2593676 RepID=UPI000741376A|nr:MULTISPECIES: endonuclease/exonuclease/phosphatase family protein [unclassified Streptomyces]KUJ38078.1 metal-dependent hydrolase [Streptomyces sp. NRRL F-5122]MDX3261106.1 endonuclease/exonuclease/phosphatase family protein [Streptomyces sp. MI02-2A]REE64598.1 endonuclease/exonuclease/phosphatase family metal-dependent hydrolase [Streptomyces sp. 3212.3]
MKRANRLSVYRSLAAGVLAFVAFGATTPGVATARPSTAAEQATRSVPLRVATYNIHAGAGEDNVFDLDRTADAVRALHADVIGLQEVDVHWDARSNFTDEAHELAARLHMRVFFAPIYDLPPAPGHTERRQYGVAILSRHPIVRAENHEITRLSTQDPNPVPAPAPGFAEVTLRVRGTDVHVYSTHLDYRADPTVRRTQVDDMSGILAQDFGPKVLVGDFNAEPGAPELAKLWGPLADAAPQGGKTYPAITPVKRIDVVSVSPEVTVTGTREEETAASDHRPVVADLLLHRRGI